MLMQNENVRKPSTAQVLELAGIFTKNLPINEMDFDLIQNWIENPKAIAKGLREMLIPLVVDITDVMVASMLADWQQFWANEGIEIDITQVKVPARRLGFDRLLVIPQGMTAEKAFQLCKKYFACWKYTDKSLDEVVSKDDRDPSSGAYAIWVRDRVEADKEHKNKSADNLEGSVVGITLPEREVYGLKYFKETGKHLDQKNVTLCTGSRDSSGGVPRVDWHDNEMTVNYCGPDDADDDLRVREVVI